MFKPCFRIFGVITSNTIRTVIAKDPSVKTNKTEKDFITIPHTQKQLLLGAIDSVNHAGTGGYIVSSSSGPPPSLHIRSKAF